MSRRFCVSAIRAPGLTDAEVRRRLGRVYSLILQHAAEKTADRLGTAEVSQPLPTAGSIAVEREDQ